ncbi:hypothetical protein T552_01370 [Pneumocystis carinii B80]|uniref:Iron-sulfur assembly protein 1 n=1 Tax=Pneumocystis carinii (strain B80) TaxID=1408658 RepID=A0A0W4ZM35_PNEC8|nr:hypothetical protein T552_01370 [Pneumocystis carinii B80]KTW29419.1 hypothetical protein T552_01370 [Pneumocystis carinii B80]
MLFEERSACFWRNGKAERLFLRPWLLKTNVHREFLQTYQKPSSTLWMHQNISSPVKEKQREMTRSASFLKTKYNPRKTAMTLTPRAVERLKELLNQPEPKMIRIGTKRKGCAGLSYLLEYVDEPGKYDETIIQDGVAILIDNRALFTIIGSKMDWVQDKLAARFVFDNPNATSTCGCQESFSIN